MGDYNEYSGGSYPLDSQSQGPFGNYRIPTGSFSISTDPRLVNQLDAVSKKINTGIKNIEMEGLQAQTLESIPEQHLSEINRLRKLAGVSLTLHGPIIEPTGVTKQGWEEVDRLQAERQMQSALMRAHKLNPEGNVIVTFHSTAGLPPAEEKFFNPETGKEEIHSIMAVDERTGQFAPIPIRKDYFLEGTEKEMKEPKDFLEKHNKESWTKELTHLNFNAENGARQIEHSIKEIQKDTENKPEETDKILEFYKDYISGKAGDTLKELGEFVPQAKERIQRIMTADIYLRDAYQELQNMFNQAYDAAQRSKSQEDINKLENFKKEISPKLKGIEDPMKLKEFGDMIIKGVEVLRSVNIPETLKPMRNFVIDKSSETFSNMAIGAYKQFKGTAPIISIENPPAGQGSAMAEDLRDIIKTSRDKFVEKAKSELGMSESEAKKQADKLIGATWDVGHINMLRKLGYGDEQLKEQTKIVAPFVKHIHLSDNFGLEHTEMPMGMGNVPMNEHLAELQKAHGDKLKEIKQVIEAGNWYEPFKTSPLTETFKAFGSPIYGMKMAPYWNNVPGQGGYSAGYGMMLPEGNFNMYGAGFSNLPTELGGQMSGRSRVSGNAME